MSRKTDNSRRKFIKQSASFIGTYPLMGGILAAGNPIKSPEEKGIRVGWLNRPTSSSFAGATCGVCWPQGTVTKKTGFAASDDQSRAFSVQSWPLAYWPDGSLKWTAHAFNNKIASAERVYIRKLKSQVSQKGLVVEETDDSIMINTGMMRCVVEKKGKILLRSITRNENEIIKSGRLTLLLQDKPDDDSSRAINKQTFQSTIKEVKIEQRGPVRAVIKISGVHEFTDTDRGLIPFVVRMYFYDQSDSIRLLHTIIYDVNEDQDFIKGIGLSFEVPMKDELYNRHIRFVNSEHKGIFAEAIKGLTGLRRDPGKEIRERQLRGEAVSAENMEKTVSSRLQYIPAFGDYTLSQTNADSFSIRKRTGAEHSWLNASQGHRAAGVVYLGTPQGGMVAGIRNFWQSHPAQIDVRNAQNDVGTVTLWLWAPDAPAMDLRFYHDGMGQDTFEKQREGLEINYEDYEPGFGTPKGVARTSELMIWAVEATPSRDKLLEIASIVQDPPTLICDIKHMAQLKMFGGNWNLVDRSAPEKAAIETRLDQYFEYYKNQVDQHRWYGFWDYGDFMHSYDTDRHVWKYDVGGYAWDNSELSTDLWLWYFFLHTGRSDVFRMAEAMTRHTGEVDVHHLGPFAPLGSRHNVMHWGCSAKQLRISTAANRRIYYYLTADERVGDLLDEQVDAAKKLADILPTRKLPGQNKIAATNNDNMVYASFGTDWGAIAAAWLTKWERTGDPEIKNKLVNSMTTIGMQPKGFFNMAGWLDLSNGKFKIPEDPTIGISHLSAVFGLVEVCAELIQLINVPVFTKAWLHYCRFYNAPAEEQTKELGRSFRVGLSQGHSRLTAFAANHLKDEVLSQRAWKEFYGSRSQQTSDEFKLKTITGPAVLYPVEENDSVSTNDAAQWGLAAIQCLAYVGNSIRR